MVPTDEEKALRKMLIKRIERVILLVYPRAKVEVFGSYSTGLYLPSSDLDIVIIDKTAISPACFNRLMAMIQKYKVASTIEFVKAKVTFIFYVSYFRGSYS